MIYFGENIKIDVIPQESGVRSRLLLFFGNQLKFHWNRTPFCCKLKKRYQCNAKSLQPWNFLQNRSCGDWTLDLRIISPPCYQLSYGVLYMKFWIDFKTICCSHINGLGNFAHDICWIIQFVFCLWTLEMSIFFYIMLLIVVWKKTSYILKRQFR